MSYDDTYSLLECIKKFAMHIYKGHTYNDLKCYFCSEPVSKEYKTFVGQPTNQIMIQVMVCATCERDIQSALYGIRNYAKLNA